MTELEWRAFAAQDCHPQYGVSIGSSFTRICSRSRGQILAEPPVVMMLMGANQPLAVGNDALWQIRRDTRVPWLAWPVRSGIINQPDQAEAMLRRFLRQLLPESSCADIQLLVTLSAGLSAIEESEWKTVIGRLGCRALFFVPKILCAAFGAGLGAEHPTASMFVDIGSDSTEAAVLSPERIQITRNLRM
jgi:rod shape-determining protein MreB and related proteins